MSLFPTSAAESSNLPSEVPLLLRQGGLLTGEYYSSKIVGNQLILCFYIRVQMDSLKITWNNCAYF